MNYNDIQPRSIKLSTQQKNKANNQSQSFDEASNFGSLFNESSVS